MQDMIPTHGLGVFLNLDEYPEPSGFNIPTMQGFPVHGSANQLERTVTVTSEEACHARSILTIHFAIH